MWLLCLDVVTKQCQTTETFVNVLIGFFFLDREKNVDFEKHLINYKRDLSMPHKYWGVIKWGSETVISCWQKKVTHNTWETLIHLLEGHDRIPKLCCYGRLPQLCSQFCSFNLLQMFCTSSYLIHMIVIYWVYGKERICFLYIATKYQHKYLCLVTILQNVRFFT